MSPLNELKSTFEQKGHRSLLFTLMLMIFVSPFLYQQTSGVWVLAVILVLVLFTAAITVSSYKRHFIFALVLGVPALFSQLSVFNTGVTWLEPARYLTTALFFFWVCGLLLRDIVLRSHKVTLNLIMGAVNIYLMIGVGFAFVFAFIEYAQPGSFTGLEDLAAIPDSVLYFLYFSFITMSTLGYGDISPLTPYGMTAAYTVAIFGQLYLAILVARLVAMYMDTHRNTDQELK